MTDPRWYGADPLMGPVDRLPLVGRLPGSQRSAPGGSRPLGVRLARGPVPVGEERPARLGEHSKTYTFDKKTENMKIIIDGNEENHPDTREVEREFD
jgi:hypothetical protein